MVVAASGMGLVNRRAEDTPTRVIFDMPERLVVIGDLNGDDDALALLLRVTGLTDEAGRWSGGARHLVQLGDVVNRGSGCRAALDRLMALQRQAREAGGEVTMILGNHESMVTLGNLAWCTTEEFVEFASPGECAAFEHRRTARLYELLALSRRGRVTLPVAGALRAWEEQHAPGRLQYLESMGPRGVYGRFLRSLPVAVRVGPLLLTHGGLSEAFAAAGLLGLQEELSAIWSTAPESEDDLELTSLLLSEDGPLWNRSYVQGQGAAVQASLERSLRSVGASVMVVGHTRTDHVPGGRLGHPALLHDDRLIVVDTGIGTSGAATAALVVEGDEISMWRPDAPFRTLARITPLHAIGGGVEGSVS